MRTILVYGGVVVVFLMSNSPTATAEPVHIERASRFFERKLSVIQLLAFKAKMDREMNETKTPTSWYIWLGLWILPLLFSIGTYQVDPAAAIGTWIGTGILVVLMLSKTKWVLPWFSVVLILDLIGYGILFGEGSGNVAQLFGAMVKELIFLGYLLFSENAKRHQGRFSVIAENSSPAALDRI